MHGAKERGGVLCEGGTGGAEDKRDQAASLAKKFHVLSEKRGMRADFADPITKTRRC